jgi:LysM repeat protein
MKKIILLSIIFCSLSIFSQNNKISSEFNKVILDGKTAYMNINTGEIVTEIPNKGSNEITKKVSNEVYSNSPIVTNKTNLETHYVVSGETLSSISRNYGISIPKLKDLNANIDFNNLKINQKININHTIDVISSNEYVVKKGNTLYSISKMFAISVDDLKRFNNLNSTLISVGQKLRIK